MRPSHDKQPVKGLLTINGCGGFSAIKRHLPQNPLRKSNVSRPKQSGFFTTFAIKELHHEHQH